MNIYRQLLKKVILASLCLYVVMVSVIHVEAYPSPQKIRVAIPAQGQYGGYTEEYLKKISKYTNWEFEFIKVTGDIHQLTNEMLQMLENGEIDIIGPIEMNNEILNHCELTGYHYGITYSTISVLTENTTASETDYRTLNGLRIAVQKSATERITGLKRFCSSNGIKYELIECESEGALYNAIKSGRADAVLGSNTSPMENTRIVAKFAGVPYYFATKKTNVEILKGLNMAMNRIDQTDPYFSVRLNKKYFVDNINTIVLTQEEKEYISRNPVLTVITLDGVAPLQYADENGKLTGISRSVLDEISNMTGLVFEYRLVDSLAKALTDQEADIFCGIPYDYASYTFPDMVLSQPFLKSSTILYLHSSLNARELNDKTYAAVRGSALPEGIKEEHAIYFNTREESLDAVNAGQADYGYGNAYSVAFYTLQNGYKNIVTIPREKESREYCMGFINGDKLLVSIINKALGAIDESKMQNLILGVTSHVDRKVTPLMILNTYGKEVVAIISVASMLLLFGIICNIQSNIKLKIQNRRYEVLSEISNEYLYEYNIKKDLLILSDKCTQLFGMQGAATHSSSILKNSLVNYQLNNYSADRIYEIKLPLANGEMGVFKVINSSVCDGNGKVEFIIGKLIDISAETAEKEALITKAQMDGLTGLYNSATSKELIMERINYRDQSIMDVLVILDVDLFKDVNDRLGHYTGDQVLQELAKHLKRIFRKTDIIGRIGGDEFCVYIEDIPSMEFVQRKCQQLNELVGKTIGGVPVSVSIGIALVEGVQTYEKVFQMADTALYQAKHNGRGQFVVF